MKKHGLPMGVRDALGVECMNARRMEHDLRDVFLSWGFQEISTPGIEYMDVFRGDIGRVDIEKMFKFTDSRGRLLVLRPDNTLPIARAVSAYYRDIAHPLRLFYLQSAYIHDESPTASLWERPQAGLEMLGDASPEADAEIIACAIQSLLDTGLSDFQVDIGQVGFFKGLMEEAGLSDDIIDTLRGYVESKNALALEMLLKETEEISPGLHRRIMALPMLYGEEALEKARGITDYPPCRAALDNLETVLALLEDWNLREYATVDLGRVHAVHYYSGIIFRGLVSGIGQPILSGGRYDALTGDFGRDLPATGCALYLRHIMQGLILQDKLRAPKPLGYVLGYARARHAAAARMAAELREKGDTVELLHGVEAREMPGIRAERGALYWRYIEEDGSLEGDNHA